MGAKVSFVTEVTQDVVYTCDDPPLIVTYDRQISVHSVWTYRQAKAEVLLYLIFFPNIIYECWSNNYLSEFLWPFMCIFSPGC